MQALLSSWAAVLPGRVTAVGRFGVVLGCFGGCLGGFGGFGGCFGGCFRVLGLF
jgi:hypothetical protein